MQAGSTTASHQASQFAIFISYFSAVAAVVAYAHLAMLGSQPKTDFFCDNERHRPQHDWKQRTTLKEKKRRKEINLQHATKAAFRCCRRRRLGPCQ